jgi:hypothetical protein
VRQKQQSTIHLNLKLVGQSYLTLIQQHVHGITKIKKELREFASTFRNLKKQVAFFDWWEFLFNFLSNSKQLRMQFVLLQSIHQYSHPFVGIEHIEQVPQSQTNLLKFPANYFDLELLPESNQLENLKFKKHKMSPEVSIKVPEVEISFS